ncbi:MAG: DUF3696 domain-containing protein [Alphaproteobacteria bacterium]|nr:DUF3696 domain-containing protein [Alphaproteobacteria bacterium]
MLRTIRLQHFKCFETLKLPIADLTLLSGANASGKSSVLQGLVLLHQTMRNHEWSTRLVLNGDSIKLGAVADVVDKVYGRFAFEIGLADDEGIVGWRFSGERSQMSMVVDEVTINQTTKSAPEELQHMLPRDTDIKITSFINHIRNLTYLTAERVGPREFYLHDDPQVATSVGPSGEHAIGVLHSGRDEVVLDELVIDGIPPTRLRQVEARMQKFFPGCSLTVEIVPQANAVMLGLRTADDTGFHRPIHVGFGLTQVLPIIVAALSSGKDDIILIENPEVHLHPAGQALMGQFLAEVAQAGVQVIIETHSDHVLNGIRRVVRSGMPPQKVAIHFFAPRSEGRAQVVSPQLDSKGNIDVWPRGFFDQFDKDVNYFAGWGD